MQLHQQWQHSGRSRQTALSGRELKSRKTGDASRQAAEVGLVVKEGDRGRVALIYQNNYTAKSIAFEKVFTTFELLGVNLSFARTNIIIVIIYRTGVLSELFYTELTALLETMAVYSCDVIITGDFNIHVDDDTDRYAVKFLDLIRSFGLAQRVAGPTHNRGHTLDLVITRDNFPINTPKVDPPLLSDHSLVLFQLPIIRPPLEYRDVSTRKWKGFDRQSFKTDVLASRLCQPSEAYSDMTTDELQDIYDAELQSLLDRHAPRRITKCRYQPMTPWFDTECKASRRKSRMFERRYRRTRLPADRLAWTLCWIQFRPGLWKSM